MNMSYSDRQYSLGTITGTVVDSAAKHIRQCKVQSDIMSVWATCNQQEMHQNRMKYITHKDDLVLNVSQKIGRSLAGKVDVYPSCVSNFADIDRNTQSAFIWLYDSESPLDFLTKVHKIGKQTDTATTEILAWMDDHHIPREINTKRLHNCLAKMPYMQAQGYAQTAAYASAQSGDTVLSVLIGGIVTVRNGHFPMRCGQTVQWYFNFEKEHFCHSHLSMGISDWDIGARIKYDDHQNAGEIPLTDRRGKMDGHPNRTMFALPKPYVISSKDGLEFYGDKIRIFAKCIGGGGAHEMVDQQLTTQSL